MKSAVIAMLMLAAVAASAQGNLHDPKSWPKDWSIEMCSKNSPTRIQEGLVRYCQEFAPTAKPPACPKAPVPAYAKAWDHGGGSYLEPLDCQYHMGTDPRKRPPVTPKANKTVCDTSGPNSPCIQNVNG